jgi:hypothetical protein
MTRIARRPPGTRGSFQGRRVPTPARYVPPPGWDEPALSQLPDLPYATRARMRSGSTADSDRDLRRSEYAVLCSMANHAYTFEEVECAFLDPTNAGLRRFQAHHEVNPDRAVRDLLRQWELASRFVSGNPAECDSAMIGREIEQTIALVQANADLFRGRAGSSTRHFVLCVLSYAYQVKSKTVHVSVRQAAEYMQCTKETAGRASKRACESGLFIERIAAGNSTNPTLYRVTDRQARATDTAALAQIKGSTVSISLARRAVHEVFTSAGLGLGAARVYEALCARACEGEPTLPQGNGGGLARSGERQKTGPIEDRAPYRRSRPGSARSVRGMTAQELAQMTGMHTSSVRRIFLKLVSCGLANKSGDRPPFIYVVGDATLEAVAQHLGVHGTALRKRRKHEAERRDHLLKQHRLGRVSIRTRLDGETIAVDRRTGRTIGAMPSGRVRGGDRRRSV